MKTVLKVLFLQLVLIFLVTQCEEEQVINIPDKSFLNALIERGVDGNGDGSISPLEADVITSINVPVCGISDMTGIEEFGNLVTLDCYGNQLTTLDISNNIDLHYLVCAYNQLSSLDVSNSNDLQELMCHSNQITGLDISSNYAIQTFWFNNMPTLFEVCVWTLPFPPAGIHISDWGSPNVYYTTDCTK